MAQRGGSVFSNIRIGSEVYAPLISEGRCDILIAVEPSEAMRNIVYLSESSLVILNTRKVVPFTVFLGKSGYPSLDEIVRKLTKVSGRVIPLDAAQIAEEAGNPLSTNVVMLGALFGTGRMPIKIEAMKAVIRTRSSARAASVNITAFELGYRASRQALKEISVIREAS